MTQTTQAYFTDVITKRGASVDKAGTISASIYGYVMDMGQLPVETLKNMNLVGITLVACSNGVFVLSNKSLPIPLMTRIVSLFDRTQTEVLIGDWAVFIPNERIIEMEAFKDPFGKGGVMLKYQRENGETALFRVTVRIGNTGAFMASMQRGR